MLKDHFLSLTVAVLIVWTSPVRAQVPQQHPSGTESEHQHEMQSHTKSLSEQVGDLSRQVSELEAKVREQGVDTAAMKANGDESRLKMSMGTLGGVPQAPSQQSIAPTGGNNPMPDMGDMMAGMMTMMNSMMGGMAGGSPMSPPLGIGGSAILSSLPGFPGASHLYHIGSTNFFLDHPDHITLALEQQSRLGEFRMQALLRRSEFNRKIQEGEEQLWLLTAADQPNLALVEGQIREIEKLRADLRLGFIKDVGEAAKILSDGQRKALLGQLSPSVQVTPNATSTSKIMEGM